MGGELPLFANLNDQIFLPFSRGNRWFYEECLVRLYRRFYKDAPRYPRDSEVIADIYETLKNRSDLWSDDDILGDLPELLVHGRRRIARRQRPTRDAELADTVRARAIRHYEYLIETGWLEEEQFGIVKTVDMSPGALALMETLHRIREGFALRFSGTLVQLNLALKGIAEDPALNALSLNHVRRDRSKGSRTMKITELKTFVVGNAWKNWVFVKVFTDEGIVGVGEATGGLSTKPGEAQVHELGRFVIGEDPRHPEYIRDRMYKGLFLDSNVGVAAIEIACWDILGKSLGVPVWQLLGGKQRPRLRAYANGWYQGPRDPGFFAEAATRVKEKGYTALKFDPFGAAYRFMDRDDEKFSLKIIRAVRDAVGPDVDLLIEGHDRFGVSTAIRIGRALEEFEPMWFETPVMSTDLAATVEVARNIPVPVATGERMARLSEMIDLVSHRAVDIVQPETLNVGGIMGAKKMAIVAESAEAFVALHQAQSPLNTAINAHIHASLPNFLIQECFDDFNSSWAFEIMEGVPRVIDGYIEPSDEPGLGVELHEDEMKKYPFGNDNFLRLFEDGWELRRRKNPS